MNHLLALARKSCANYRPNGSCEGVCFNDDGSLRCSPVPLDRCALAEDKPCSYFAECVAPLDAKALALYGKKVRLCACGVVLLPRRKMCRDCREISRKERARAGMKERRRLLTLQGGKQG